MKTLILILIALFAGLSVVVAQSEATQIADRDFRRADAALNDVYKQVLARITDKKIKLDLQKAQSAWLRYRDLDASCRAGISSRGGSAYGTDYLGNLTDLTEKRTD